MTNATNQVSIKTPFGPLTVRVEPRRDAKLAVVRDERPAGRSSVAVREARVREAIVRISAAIGHEQLWQTHRVQIVEGELWAGADLPLALLVAGADPALAARCVGALCLEGQVREVDESFVLGHQFVMPVGHAASALAELGHRVEVVETLRDAFEARFSEMPARPLRFAADAAPLVPRRLCLVGAPGCGKTLRARAIRDELGPVTEAEHRDVLATRAMAHLLADTAPVRPFRAPHHTVSMAGMVGKDSRPGEARLARHGVLMLDELPEFSLSVIQELARVVRNEPVVIVATACPDRLVAANRRLELLGIKDVEVMPEPEPWCACGRPVSRCDGSRAGCARAK